MVNELRKKNGLNELDLVFVDMILVEENKEVEDHKFSNKASSTQIREFISKIEESKF